MSRVYEFGITRCRSWTVSLIALKSWTKWHSAELGLLTGRIGVLYGGLQDLIGPVFKNLSGIGYIPFWASCIREYYFRLGVPASFLNGICIGLTFLAFPGVPPPHTFGLFVDLSGEEVPSPSLGFLWEPSVGLNMCSGGTHTSRCPGEKVTWAFSLQRRSQPKRDIGHSGTYKKLSGLLIDVPMIVKMIRGGLRCSVCHVGVLAWNGLHPCLLEGQSVCSSLSVLTGALVGIFELGATNPGEPLGCFIHHLNVPLSLPSGRPQLFSFPQSSFSSVWGIPSSNAPPLYNTCIFPCLVIVAFSFGIQCGSQKSGISVFF